MGFTDISVETPVYSRYDVVKTCTVHGELECGFCGKPMHHVVHEIESIEDQDFVSVFCRECGNRTNISMYAVLRKRRLKYGSVDNGGGS